MQEQHNHFHKPIEVCHIEIRVLLSSHKPFKVIYLNADKNIIIPQATKGMPYRNPSSFDQVMGFKRCKPYRNPSSFDQVQAHEGMPYRNPSSFDQVLGF